MTVPRIVKAKETDAGLIAELGRKTFIESHGSSASSQDISSYTNEKYGEDLCYNELQMRENIYHIIYYDQLAAGYSKILLNSSHANISAKKVSKLERLYVLETFYDLNLGKALFNFNVELSQKQGQEGMWLYVWQENKRAIHFYEKMGFKIIGRHDFKLTNTHSNPNHQMFLKY